MVFNDRQQLIDLVEAVASMTPEQFFKSEAEFKVWDKYINHPSYDSYDNDCELFVQCKIYCENADGYSHIRDRSDRRLGYIDFKLESSLSYRESVFRKFLEARGFTIAWKRTGMSARI